MSERNIHPIREAQIKGSAVTLYQIGKIQDGGTYFEQLRLYYDGDKTESVNCAKRVLTNGFEIQDVRGETLAEKMRNIGISEFPVFEDHEIPVFLAEFGELVLKKAS
ncbi:MAG: hypothetical protein HY044_04740 [Candidatus Woesebacteria bacterium]|nr:MAG: hypothetical protein HY044_04740 [Candidatus Woesebacteria bacterium]